MRTPQPFIHDWFSDVAARTPDAIAIAHGARQVAYATLDDESDRLANRLRADGLAVGQTIAILAADPVRFVSAVLGVLKAGGVFVPLDPRLPAARRQAIVDEVAPRLLLADAELAVAARELARGAPLLTIDEAVTGPAGRPGLALDPDAPCYVFFSSGSTGRPKGIVGRLKAIDHFIRWEIGALGIGPDARVSQLTATGFDAVLRELFVPLCAGGTLVAPLRRDALFDAAALLRWLENERITLLHGVPSLFFGLLGEPLRAANLPALRHVLLAGEVVPPGAADRWLSVFGERIALVNLYGPSETTMVKFAHRIRDEDRRRASIPIGRPIDGTEALLLDEAGALCAPGAVGEIHIRTAYRSLGYLNRPDLTAAAFIPNPHGDGDPDDLLYRTGDFGRLGPDGVYEFLGRKDAQLKIRGVRVEPAEIEEALRAHPAIREAGVAALPDGDGQLTLRAWVTAPDGVDEAALRAWLAARLPDALVPGAFVVVAALPRTASGKLDRAALPALEPVAAVAPADAAQADAAAPRTDTERRLAAIWSAVLGRDQIGVDDNFFRIGGHSLLVMSMMSRVRREFGDALVLRHFFAGPTLGAFARQIDTLGATPGAGALEIGEL